MSAIAHRAAMLPLADSRPLRVVAFNTADGWMRDVTADIAPLHAAIRMQVRGRAAMARNPRAE